MSITDSEYKIYCPVCGKLANLTPTASSTNRVGKGTLHCNHCGERFGVNVIISGDPASKAPYEFSVFGRRPPRPDHRRNGGSSADPLVIETDC